MSEKEKILHKSMRLKKQDIINLNRIVELDPRVQNGFSEAISLSIEDAEKQKTDWKDIGTIVFKKDLNKIVHEDELKKNRAFYIKEDTFKNVYNDVRSTLGLSRPRISFVVRLTIINMRYELEKKHVRDNSNNASVNIINIDGIKLINKVTELLMNSDDLTNKEKILRIKTIIEEGDNAR
ncbi:hypothetical protein [Senegalia sp. (in: firmicutes)]|uniref:hypothetical protein n=1 Tax=Senegalia sp. (in: firmicutes) TaxID=1924098 RepID=UPI003F9C2AE4